ncbi:MAG: gliding motility lipoprotein GldH [Niabella sp.]
MVFIISTTKSCTPVTVQERTVTISAMEWKANQKAIVKLAVPDSAYYSIFFVMRHTEKYAYNNMLAVLTIQDTALKAKPFTTLQLTIPLTNNNGKWIGENMDDLYYTRVKISQPVFFKPGMYKFILQHKMKDNPLSYVMNVGAAIRKTTPQP